MRVPTFLLREVPLRFANREVVARVATHRVWSRLCSRVDRINERRLPLLLAQCQNLGLKPAEIPAAIRMVSQPATFGEVLAYISTIPGALWLIRQCVVEPLSESELDELAVDAPNVAAVLCGFGNRKSGGEDQGRLEKLNGYFREQPMGPVVAKLMERGFNIDDVAWPGGVVDLAESVNHGGG